MHALLAMTAMHDRYLKSPNNVVATPYECFHHSRAAALLNSTLSNRTSAPCDADERNALWSTAVMLCNISFFCVDSVDPEQSWLLKTDPDPDDENANSELYNQDQQQEESTMPSSSLNNRFHWLNMSEGLRVMWNIATPGEPGGLFHILSQKPQNAYLQTKLTRSFLPGIQGIPEDFVELYEMSESSATENHPYHAAVRSISELLAIECTQDTIVKFMGWTATLTKRFRALLAGRDPRALLLLAYWYAKTSGTLWWINLRSGSECMAICLYLERECRGQELFLKMLEYPRSRCGLVTDCVVVEDVTDDVDMVEQ